MRLSPGGCSSRGRQSSWALSSEQPQRDYPTFAMFYIFINFTCHRRPLQLQVKAPPSFWTNWKKIEQLGCTWLSSISQTRRWVLLWLEMDHDDDYWPTDGVDKLL